MTSSISAMSMTPDERALAVVLAVLFGWFGWRMSRNFRAASGVTPWHLPSGIWAVICFVFNVLGLLLVLIAQFTTRGAVGGPPGTAGRVGFGRRGGQPAPWPARGAAGVRWQGSPRAGGGGPRGGAAAGPGPAGRGPAGPGPAGRGPAGGGAALGEPGHGGPALGDQPLGGPAPLASDPGAVRRYPPPLPGPRGEPPSFGWYRDVTGRHAERYYDGRDWTQLVRDDGLGSEDPL